MAPLQPHHARRLWSSLFLESRSLAVLLSLVVGWMILHVIDAPTRAAQLRAASAPRAGTEVAPLTARAPGAGHAAPTGPSVPGPASSTFRLPDELPLRRVAGSDGVVGSASFRGALLCVSMLALGTLLLRSRFRAPAPRTSGEPRRGGWLRWLAPGASSPPIRVVQSTRLTTRASVHVLQWDDKEWLVGCTEHGMTVLAQRAPAAERCPEAPFEGAGTVRPAGHPQCAAPDLVEEKA